MTCNCQQLCALSILVGMLEEGSWRGWDGLRPGLGQELDLTLRAMGVKDFKPASELLGLELKGAEQRLWEHTRPLVTGLTLGSPRRRESV